MELHNRRERLPGASSQCCGLRLRAFPCRIFRRDTSERVTGIEPAEFCMASRLSTLEKHPHLRASEELCCTAFRRRRTRTGPLVSRTNAHPIELRVSTTGWIPQSERRGSNPPSPGWEPGASPLRRRSHVLVGLCCTHLSSVLAFRGFEPLPPTSCRGRCQATHKGFLPVFYPGLPSLNTRERNELLASLGHACVSVLPLSVPGRDRTCETTA